MKRPENIKRIRTLRKIRLFLIFFALSFLVWFIVALSSNYEVTIKTKLSFENENRIEIKNQFEKIKVNTEGFYILYYYLFSKKIILPSSYIKCENKKCFIPVNSKIIQKTQQQWFNAKILAYQNDTLFLNFTNRSYKKVKVISQVNIFPKKGYLLEKPIKIIPDSVLIFGEEKYLEKIQTISTQSIEIQNISNVFEQNIPLVLNENLIDKVFVNIEKVKIYGIFSKYTEIEKLLPITFENENDKNFFDIIPNNAKVTLVVKLDDANKINFDVIKIQATYNHNLNIKQKAVLNLKEKPNYLFHYKIEPSYVDFIISNKK